MAEIKQLADTALQVILDTDAVLVDGSRAAANYDNSIELDFLADFLLFVVYDTTAPSVGVLVAELYGLSGNGATPEMFPTGGDGIVGKDVNPQSGIVGTFRAKNPGINTATGITAATAANPVVITDVAHGLATGDHVYLASLGGMVEVNDRFFEINVLTADTFELIGEDGTGHTAYTSGGTWFEVDVMEANDVPLGPNGNRFVLENKSGQTFSAEWELRAQPKKVQSA